MITVVFAARQSQRRRGRVVELGADDPQTLMLGHPCGKERVLNSTIDITAQLVFFLLAAERGTDFADP